VVLLAFSGFLTALSQIIYDKLHEFIEKKRKSISPDELIEFLSDFPLYPYLWVCLFIFNIILSPILMWFDAVKDLQFFSLFCIYLLGLTYYFLSYLFIPNIEERIKGICYSVKKRF